MPLIASHKSKSKLGHYLYKKEVWLVYKNQNGVDNKIIDRIFKALEVMQTYYSRIRIVFLQLHTNEYTKDNSVMSRFMQEFKRSVSKHYKCRVGFVWVREHSMAEGQHYHLALMVSGHNCLRSKVIQNKADTIWHKQNPGGYSWRVKNKIYTVMRGCKRSFQAVILRLSYFAKMDTKEHRNPMTKRFQISHLKPKLPPQATMVV